MPGLVDTPLMESAPPAFFDAALAEIPLGRVGVPADIAPTIVFLCSDDSAYYNGAEIVIDGGLTAHVSHKGIADATRPPAVKLATLRQGAAVVDDDAAYLAADLPAHLIELGLERALEIGDRRATASRSRTTRPTCCCRTSRRASATSSPSSRTSRACAAHRPRRRRPGGVVRRPDLLLHQPARALRPGGADHPPATCRALDFELEVACVVGSTLRSASESEAADAIFGYTILNDWSARDIQSREMQVGLGPAKGKDFATSFGPWIVTADELPVARPRLPRVRQRRADRPRQTCPTCTGPSPSWSPTPPATRSSSPATCSPPAPPVAAAAWPSCGAATATQTPPPLEPGDVVRLEVEGLGTLTGSVARN